MESTEKNPDFLGLFWCFPDEEKSQELWGERKTGRCQGSSRRHPVGRNLNICWCWDDPQATSICNLSRSSKRTCNVTNFVSRGWELTGRVMEYHLVRICPHESISIFGTFSTSLHGRDVNITKGLHCRYSDKAKKLVANCLTTSYSQTWTCQTYFPPNFKCLTTFNPQTWSSQTVSDNFQLLSDNFLPSKKVSDNSLPNVSDNFLLFLALWAGAHFFYRQMACFQRVLGANFMSEGANFKD